MRPENETFTSEEQMLVGSRRNFATKAAMVAGGVIFGATGEVEARVRSGGPIDLGALPSAWVQRQGPSRIYAYGKFLQRLNLRHVSPQQVVKAHARRKGSTWNSLPPANMWRPMARSLKVADMIARLLGQNVKNVTSAYRSPAYNRRCPGASKKSWHMRNYALDLQFGSSPYRVAQAARYLRNKGYFKGGVGRYKTFTHVDTRGENVDW